MITEHATPLDLPPYSEADFSGSLAAPLKLMGGHGSKQLVRRQDALADKFFEASLYELKDVVKPRIAEYVGRTIVNRMHEREGLNSISYLRRLHKEPDYEQISEHSRAAIRRACKLADVGLARVAQNDIAFRAYGMPTGEYANFTRINDLKKSQEAPMWDEVSELVGIDAHPHARDMDRLQLVGFDRDPQENVHLGAMQISMKRWIGVLDDGTEVKARTTAIINTSPSSGFNQELAAEIREEILDKKDVTQLAGFCRAVTWLVENEPPSGLVLARNETVYGVNQERMAQVWQRDRWDK